MRTNRLIFFLIILTVSSCTVYKDFPIEIYKPGVIKMPEEGLNVGILSRNFKYEGDTLQNYYKKDSRLTKDRNNNQLNIDSIANTQALSGLANALQENGSFGKIEIFPLDMIKPHSGDKLPIFNWEAIKDFSSTANTDIIISLETLSYFYSTYSTSLTGDPPSAEVITACVWSVYDPSSEEIIDHKQMIDTIFWDGYDKNMNKIYSEFPDRLDGIEIACKLAGESYAKRFIPSWQEVYRMYVIPPIEDFRIAAQYFEGGKWNEAINVLQIYAPDKFKKLAINARYNIAFGYEMMDDIANALAWIDRARDLAVSLRSKEDIKMIINYKNVLLQRQAEFEKFNQ